MINEIIERESGEISEDIACKEWGELENLVIAQAMEIPNLLNELVEAFRAFAHKCKEYTYDRLVTEANNNLQIAKIIVDKAEKQGLIDRAEADQIRFTLSAHAKRKSRNLDEARINGSSANSILKEIKKADLRAKTGQKDAFMGLSGDVKNIARSSKNIIDITRNIMRQIREDRGLDR